MRGVESICSSLAASWGLGIDFAMAVSEDLWGRVYREGWRDKD
jgi:hypothetical protein